MRTPLAEDVTAGAARRRATLVALAAGATLASSGCGGADGTMPSAPPTPPAPSAPLTLVLTGRLERGSTIAVSARSGTDSIAGTQLRLAVAPAGSADVSSAGAVALRQAGPLTITATTGDGRTVTTIATVQTPPTVVLDLVVDDNRDIYAVALDGGDLTRLTSDPADDSSPSVAGGTVVFSSYRTGNGDIYAVAVGGGAARRLTSTTDPDGSPALSRDGTRLAFVRPARGVDRIWVSDAAGVGAQRLTSDTPENAGAPEATPSWGAGAQLAFTSTAGGQPSIAVTTATALPAASTQAWVAATRSSVDIEPAWDGDGKRLAFISTRDGQAGLYVTDGGSETATRLTARGVNVSAPTWLRDGRIAFVSRRATGATLVWLDPATPDVLHDVPLPGRDPAHPAAVR